MYALFEDGGKFLAGRVLSEADTSAQVELDSGKRVKVKAANMLLKFEQPQPAELVAEAQQKSAEIELDLAWEFAPDEDFSFSELARDYFSDNADTATQAAMLFKLFEAPHYFRRLGKGLFKKAPEETVKAALLGIERKKQLAAQIDAWAAELAAGVCPDPIREQLYKILFRPDKNAAEYKAVVAASKLSHRAPLDLLTSAGAIDSPYQFHWKRFLFENFPQGTGFPDATPPEIREELPLAEVDAFSIDDSATTEIDDALSVRGLGSGTVVCGIHIAAPGLAFQPDSPLDRIARDRLSTVYMPGHKLTMLPDDVVQAYTLLAGRECPAVSLYVTIDEQTLEIRASETRLERVRIAANLRHDQLDAVITEASLCGDAAADYAFADELAFVFRLARHLKAAREVIRGKPETFNRPDYNFRLEGKQGSEPAGDETVVISQRQRGSPLDLIVAEAMILANSTWGRWLADCGVPGIYRSQASLAPGIKVRMGIKPAPHAGMGVSQYTWATSPLRRYVDLVNQWQIIACARHGMTAALAAPFKPRDAGLFSIISAFDAAYVAYNGFQAAIERYWTLKYLAQNGIEEFDAAVMKDGLVRAERLPLVFRALGAESLPRGALVKVRVASHDLLTLDLHAQVVSRIDDAAATLAPELANDDADEGGADGEGASPAVEPLALAIDVQDDGDGQATRSDDAPAPAR
ncbi:ribonuclease catalytic domain-containing protein [Piscinibacter sakaiensis]|uniref:ribonuclease catalytic domain-containing protein n=1 Tax=Piscinibacter sakaiensis TaxID=1547922 RepID=UPI003AB06D38